MNHRPDAPALLAVARDTLKERVLPALPDDCRYDALMVINALGIAQRECSADPTETNALRRRIDALLERDSDTLADAETALTQAIRAGRFDAPGPDRDALLDALHDLTRARLAVDNPKLLKT